MNLICPVCGSSEVDTRKQQQSLNVPYGPPAIFEERVDSCKKCGESGDFAGENDAKIEAALKTSKLVSMNEMLERMNAAGIRNAYLERSLGLPSRTVARWKAGEYSAAALALLRTVSTFPWLLEVAEAQFDALTASKKVIEAAGSLLAQYMDLHRVSYATGVRSISGEIDMHIRLNASWTSAPQNIPIKQLGQIELLRTAEG